MIHFPKISVFFVVFFVMSFQTSLAQTIGSIKGTLVSEKVPVEFVSVQVFTAKDTLHPIQHTLSDSVGFFHIEKVAFGKYILQFEMIGYSSATLNVTIDAQHVSLNTGMINLTQLSQQMKTVIIQAKKKVIEKTSTGFVVNADASLATAGGTLTDLLKNTPTVSVDENGTVTLRGKTPMMLINGRNSSFVKPDQIAASSIESIEIINNPTAQYDANTESGIINIKLKKSKKSGTNGAAVLGTGFGAKGRINSSLMLNHKNEFWNVGANYDNRFASRIRHINGDRYNYDLTSQYHLNQIRNDSRVESLQNFRVTADYSPNDNNEFGFEWSKGVEGEDNDETLYSKQFTKAEVFTSKNVRKSIEIERNYLTELTATYNRKFSDKRKSFSALLSSSFENGKQNTSINSQLLSATDANVGNPYLQKTHDYENTNVTVIKTDYVQPVSPKVVFQAGTKSTLRFLDADFQSSFMNNGTYQINTTVSNMFTFREQIHAGYIQFAGFKGEKSNPSLKFDAGVRGEQVNNEGYSFGHTNPFSNNYVKFFPTASVALYKAKDAFWKASYTKKINRPGLGDLNPFIDITDSLNQHGGNSKLKPSIIHSFELGYSKDWNAVSWYSVLFFRAESQTIRNFTVVNPNGVALNQPINFGNAQTWGTEQMINYTVHPKYNGNLSISLFSLKFDGQHLATDLVNEVFSWNAKWIHNFEMWKGSKLQLTGVYNSSVATTQGKRTPVYYADMGFQQQLGKTGHGRLGLVFSDVFNMQTTGYVMNGSNFNYTRASKSDTRAILVTFAYTFGTSFKEKLMENQFKND